MSSITVSQTADRSLEFEKGIASTLVLLSRLSPSLDMAPSCPLGEDGAVDGVIVGVADAVDVLVEFERSLSRGGFPIFLDNP